ncbi:hypothetical protein DE146DRAFT_497769 [Phaeosphaeria sp. MPI-PUGE-AT-0046c]|nr:hypothetical protein DE146DRAFT_497769 [Phaeosphaeria sp. MPI-PUGE-AT-0046c]
MSSRKRSWSGPAESTTHQKRKCSNPSYESPPILTRHVAPPTPSTSRLLPKVLHSNVPQLCIHKRFNACMLWLDVCCACADKRPPSEAYLLYVDGLGDDDTDSRSMHYCSGCQEYWNNVRIANQRSMAPRSLAVKPISDKGVTVTCADRAFNIVRSDDLTLEELQQTVALLMQCNPHILELLATDVDLDSDTDKLGCGPMDVLSYASRIHFRITDDMEDDMEDVEMEDAPALG